MRSIRRPSAWASARFLAVALLLAGMAYVTYDTQKDVHKANDERRSLRAQVSELRKEVAGLKIDNDRKDAENRRLTGLLLKHGIDPRPAPTVVVRIVPSSGPQSTSSTAPRPSATRAPAPKASPRPKPSPTPSPSPTCKVYNPVTGRCLAGER